MHEHMSIKAERVEFGLAKNESHRERMGMKQRNKFRNPPSHPPSPKTLKIRLFLDVQGIIRCFSG
tara:strand:+ start:8 stop:202 length:195 start_codon:yes stop_codon:yes gene_type:complete